MSAATASCVVFAQSVAAYGVEVVEDSSSERGRRLVAQRGFEAGDLVLANAPFSLAPFFGAERCHYCLDKTVQSGDAVRCSDCGIVPYCCKACAAADAAGPHGGPECRAFRADVAARGQLALAGSALLEAVLLGRVLRLLPPLTDRQRQQLQPPAPAPVRPAPVAATAAQVRAMRAPPDAPAAPDEDAVVAAALRYAGKAPARDAQPTKRERQVAGEARALLRAFRANNFAVQDDLLGQVASGVFPAGAILNHACLPNAVVTYRVARQDGGRAPGAAARVVQEFRAVRRIAPGEEICHSYVDLAGFATAGERRDVLRERYGFACDCAACESGFPAREGHLEAGDARKVGIADQLMARAAAEEGLEAEVRLTEAALRAYRAALGPRHAKTVTALDARLSLALIAGDFGGAAALSRELAGVRQELYGGQPHPRAALDLLTLGEILRHVGERDEAREVLARAADMLAVTNGAEHHLTAGARAMLAS